MYPLPDIIKGYILNNDRLSFWEHLPGVVTGFVMCILILVIEHIFSLKFPTIGKKKGTTEEKPKYTEGQLLTFGEHVARILLRGNEKANYEKSSDPTKYIKDRVKSLLSTFKFK